MPQTPSAYSPGAGGGVPIPDQIRSNTLYDGDPQSAMMAILRQLGYNPFKTNPFMTAMLQAAPGLRNAWELTNIGANANDINANGGTGQMFGDFLKNQLQGGSAFSTLNNVASNFGGYMNQLSGLQDRLGTDGGVNLGQLPAFLDQLDTRLSNPNKFAELYGSLVTPGLGSLGRSFQNTLGAASFSADQNRTMAPSFGQPDMPSFFEWMMGKR